MENKKDMFDGFIVKTIKNNKTYYNIKVNICGMTFQVDPKFLNSKQKALLRHKIARLVGDENNEK